MATRPLPPSRGALVEGAPLDLTLKATIDGLDAEPGAVADSVRIAERDRSVDQLPGYAGGPVLGAGRRGGDPGAAAARWRPAPGCSICAPRPAARRRN